MTKMIYSQKPYLVKALYQWIVDCQLTPYIVIDAQEAAEEIGELESYVKRGALVLDISPIAVRDLIINNRDIRLTATFSENNFAITIPMRAITSIYAKENKRGCEFSIEESDDELPPDNNGKTIAATNNIKMRLV